MQIPYARRKNKIFDLNKEGCVIMKNNDNFVTRRSFLTLAAFSGAALLTPGVAFADTGEATRIHWRR